MGLSVEYLKQWAFNRLEFRAVVVWMAKAGQEAFTNADVNWLCQLIRMYYWTHHLLSTDSLSVLLSPLILEQ